MEEALRYIVGKRIKQIRNEKNISQQDLAAKCNFEKSNLSRLEAGRTDAKLSTLEKVAKGLDVTLKELFDFQKGKSL